MNITPDQFQTTLLAWISAVTVVSGALAAAIAKVYSVIKDLKEQIETHNTQIKKLLPPVIPDDHPSIQKHPIHPVFYHFIILISLSMAMAGCTLSQKSNNASLSGTGIYYDSTTGKLGAGILHASLLTHRDGTPAQVTIQNNYSMIPFDSSLSSSTVSVNFGSPVANFSTSYSGSTASTSFSEQTK